ncbi:hypothetical protein AAE478_006834 [Parahypoxylon ruwenzoriense]
MSSIRTTTSTPNPRPPSAQQPNPSSPPNSPPPPPPPFSPSAPLSLPPYRSPSFSPLITAELARISSKTPLTGIDLSRYEAADSDQPPSTSTSTSQELQSALSRAYAASTYLGGRRAHLRLLDDYGRNAWLVGNWQLEAELQALERELAAAKRDVDLVNIQRRRVQDDVAGELKGLEDTWRRGVGRVLETEVATENLRQQVLERQRGRG